jgi:hypothetical protein
MAVSPIVRYGHKIVLWAFALAALAMIGVLLRLAGPMDLARQIVT